jgi:hypothetical protein
VSESVKPGTRCECRNPDCPGHLREQTDGPMEQCRDEANRMVVVSVPMRRFQKGNPRDDGSVSTVEYPPVPMCHFCAKHYEAEARQKAGA